MSLTVNQLVPSVVPGDATTTHTLQLKRLLEARGHRCEIYALAVHPQLEDEVRLIGELRGPSNRESFLIYQFSAYSELADVLMERRERTAVNYHNVTPFRFYWPYDRGIALFQRAAEVQVSQLGRISHLAVCDSRFNAADIKERGFKDTVVSPVLVDLAELDVEPDHDAAAMLARSRESGGAHFLCVGAIAPHKAQHDLVMAFAFYRRVFDRRARLMIVGRAMSPRYATALERLIAALGLSDSVVLAGGVSHPELVSYYRAADALVSVSEHEGFCLPLVEAMYLGVPVVAFNAGAVVETVCDGGILLDDKSPPSLCAAMWRVASDSKLRETLVGAGRTRARELSLERTRAQMSRALEAWTAS